MCLLKNTAQPETRAIYLRKMAMKVGMYLVTHKSVTVARGQR